MHSVTLRKLSFRKMCSLVYNITVFHKFTIVTQEWNPLFQFSLFTIRVRHTYTITSLRTCVCVRGTRRGRVVAGVGREAHCRPSGKLFSIPCSLRPPPPHYGCALAVLLYCTTILSLKLS